MIEAKFERERRKEKKFRNLPLGDCNGSKGAVNLAENSVQMK